MATRRTTSKKAAELAEKEPPEVALAAIVSYKKQKEVNDFINFLLGALDRNANWLNTVVGRQKNFRCALLVGAGPNRFQLQEIIYPTYEEEITLEVEMKESEDHDKVAIAALVQMSNLDEENLLKFMKTRINENSMLREDIVQGKTLGISFAILKPFAEKQYRVTERIAIGSSLKSVVPIKKRRKDEKLLAGPPLKKTRKVVY
ncbi:unnamed protein product [Arctia plantaginis]|uniref:Uncharacterized protein n=1 Tax=Arctia plantaginis TaxID=874455 RepID=A0A8S0YPT5_ARCPL|nr:unnamed protein product [Arctia plantaginis]CAB3228428.1 unnamed protein product [Arctia plantaginis]